MQKCFANCKAIIHLTLLRNFAAGRGSVRVGPWCCIGLGQDVCGASSFHRSLPEVPACASAPPHLFHLIWGNSWWLGCSVGRPWTGAGVPCYDLGKVTSPS